MTYDHAYTCYGRRWVRSRCCVRTRWSCRPATLYAFQPATLPGPACNPMRSGCNPMYPCAPGGAGQGASP
eukprot:scaffold77009_cov53-Phaeocystis_antarctica.AAC.3